MLVASENAVVNHPNVGWNCMFGKADSSDWLAYMILTIYGMISCRSGWPPDQQVKGYETCTVMQELKKLEAVKGSGREYRDLVILKRFKIMYEE